MRKVSHSGFKVLNNCFYSSVVQHIDVLLILLLSEFVVLLSPL